MGANCTGRFSDVPQSPVLVTNKLRYVTSQAAMLYVTLSTQCRPLSVVQQQLATWLQPDFVNFLDRSVKQKDERTAFFVAHTVVLLMKNIWNIVQGGPL